MKHLIPKSLIFLLNLKIKLNNKEICFTLHKYKKKFQQKLFQNTMNNFIDKKKREKNSQGREKYDKNKI